MRRLILLLLLRTPAAEPQTCPEIEMEQPQACPQSVEMTKPVRVLVAVRSTRRERRDAIRDTWCQAAARVAAWSNVSIAVRFWVGGGSLVEDARAGAESELFGDVAHTTHIAADDDVALAQAALRSFDLHAAAPTHWATVDDATYVYVDRLAASLASADEKTCWLASGSAVLGRAAAVAATRGAAAPTLPTWLSACDDASRAFHAAYGENARRVDPSTVAVTGFEPGEFAFLETGAGRGIDLPRNASQVLLNLGCNLAPVLPDDANDDADAKRVAIARTDAAGHPARRLIDGERSYAEAARQGLRPYGSSGCYRALDKGPGNCWRHHLAASWLLLLHVAIEPAVREHVSLAREAEHGQDRAQRVAKLWRRAATRAHELVEKPPGLIALRQPVKHQAANHSQVFACLSQGDAGGHVKLRPEQVFGKVFEERPGCLCEGSELLGQER